MPSNGSAVVLLHGLCDTASTWQDVIPHLRSYHEVYAPTAIGHRGGPPAPQRPATIHDVVDWAEGFLDEQDLQQPHLVGHSMGGFVAIELARRGRAKTVCALSPGGFWSSGDGLRKRTMAKVTSGAGMARLSRPIAGFALRSATIRRLWFRGSAAEHGDSITAQRAAEFIDDYLGCTVCNEILSTDEEQIAPLDPLPCPITVAWSEKDAMFPVASYGPNARERLPHATFIILEDVGHVPMMDDPALVARTILACTGAATN